MATQYTSILKLALPVQGELSGTWGDVVNDNITSMVEEAIAGRKVINTWSSNSHTLTSADGTTSESRAAILTLTDTGTALTGAGTVVCPAASKVYIVENGTGQTITVKTASGTGIAVPNTKNMVVFCDGTNVEEGITNINSLTLNGDGATVSSIKDEDNMASDSATALATQQSIKAYVDSQVGANNELSEVLANGNTTGGTDIAVGTGDDITFADSSKAIFGAGSDLQIYHDGGTSFIDDVGTGNLHIRTDGASIKIRTSANADMIVAENGGAAKLYHAGSQKLATLSTGIDVTGTAVTDGLTSAVTDGSSFAANFNHTGGSVGRNGIKITSSGTSGTSTLIEALRNTTNTVFKVDGSGNLILNNQSGNQNHILNVTGAAVFNDQGADADFRVESDSNTHMLFVDASTNRVGINNSAPAKALHVSQSGTPEIRVQNSDNNYALDLGMATTVGQVKASADIALLPGGLEKWRVDSSGNVSQTNTGAGSAAGPYLTLDRNSASPADSDLLGVLSFRGRDDGANATDYGTIAGKIADVTGGTEDGVMLFNVISGGSSRDVLTLSHNESVFNNGSADQDFRVESDSNTHMLFVDAGNNALAINSSNPSANEFRVASAANFVTSTGTTPFNITRTGGTDQALQIYVDDTNVYFDSVQDEVGLTHGGYYFRSSNATYDNQNLLIMNQTGTTFNENSLDADFRVESDSNTHMLFVDAGANHVNIGTASDFGAVLNVNGGAVFDDATILDPDTMGSGRIGIGTIADGGGFSAPGMGWGATGGNTAAIVSTGGNIYFGSGDQANANSLKTRLLINSGESVFNDDSTNTDFRVESDTNSHMLYMDAGNNRVNIGTTDVSSQGTLAVNGSAIFGRSSTTTGDLISSGGGNNDTYNGVAILSNSDGITAQANTSLSSWIVDIGGRASDGVTYPVSTRDSFGVRRVAAGGTYYSAANYLQIDAGEAVFNEDSNDQDFRVESNSNTHMLFVDASTNRVGIGGNAPDTFFYVKRASMGSKAWNADTNDAIALENDSSVAFDIRTPTGSQGLILFSDTDARAQGVIGYAHGSERFYISQNGSEQFRIETGATIFNELSADQDFRVESNSNTHMLFVDAGNDFVGINKSTPEVELHVRSTSAGAMTTFESSSANTSGGPNIRLWRNSASPADGDGLSRLLFQGMNSAAERIDYVEIQTEIIAASDGTESGLFQLETYVDGTARNRLRFNNTEGIINDGGRNLDFRVESDAYTHALFVDAGNNRVGINNSSPSGLFELQETSSTTFDATDTGGQVANGATLSVQNLSDDTNSFSQILLRTRSSSKSVSRIASLVNGTGTELVFVNEDQGSSPAERMRIRKQGQVIIPGGVTLGTSANVHTDAKTLDDYEEGTFTVTFPSGVTSPTYVIQDGSYVKIGKLVTFQIRMELSAGTANGSHIKIGGLPFTSTSASSYGGAFFNYSQGFITDIGARTMHIGANGTLISFYKTDGGQLAGTDVDDLTSTLLINGQYEVA